MHTHFTRGLAPFGVRLTVGGANLRLAACSATPAPLAPDIDSLLDLAEVCHDPSPAKAEPLDPETRKALDDYSLRQSGGADTILDARPVRERATGRWIAEVPTGNGGVHESGEHPDIRAERPAPERKTRKFDQSRFEAEATFVCLAVLAAAVYGVWLWIPYGGWR